MHAGPDLRATSQRIHTCARVKEPYRPGRVRLPWSPAPTARRQMHWASCLRTGAERLRSARPERSASRASARAKVTLNRAALWALSWPPRSRARAQVHGRPGQGHTCQEGLQWQLPNYRSRRLCPRCTTRPECRGRARFARPASPKGRLEEPPAEYPRLSPIGLIEVNHSTERYDESIENGALDRPIAIPLETAAARVAPPCFRAAPLKPRARWRHRSRRPFAHVHGPTRGPATECRRSRLGEDALHT